MHASKSHTSRPKRNAKQHTAPRRNYSKHKRYQQIVEKINYTVPLDRVKDRKNHLIPDFRYGDGTQPDAPEVLSLDETRAAQKQRKEAAEQAEIDRVANGGEPRKYSLRKRYLYDRNRRIIEKAAAVIVIQPGSDPEFYEIMKHIRADWDTAHFRNGLVHLHDKPYAKLQEFFKGPVRVLLQNDPAKVLPGWKKLQKVLTAYPNTFLLGGAIDGFAGVTKDFSELAKVDSKLHAQHQFMAVLSSATQQLIPAVEYPTKHFAQVINHHQKEVEKQASDV